MFECQIRVELSVIQAMIIQVFSIIMTNFI